MASSTSAVAAVLPASPHMVSGSPLASGAAGSAGVLAFRGGDAYHPDPSIDAHRQPWGRIRIREHTV